MSASFYSPQSHQKKGPHVFRWKGGTSKRSVVKKDKENLQRRRRKHKTFLGSEYSMVCNICGHACSSKKNFQWPPGLYGSASLSARAHEWRNTGAMRRDKRGIIGERGENSWCKKRVKDERRKGWAYSSIAICCIQLAPKGIKCTWSIRLISVSWRMLC